MKALFTLLETRNVVVGTSQSVHNDWKFTSSEDIGSEHWEPQIGAGADGSPSTFPCN